MRLRSSLLHNCREGRVSKSRRYGRGRIPLDPIHSRPTSTISDTTDGLPMAFRNYSQFVTVPSLASRESCTGSPESQLTDSSRLMLDGSSLAPRPYVGIHDSSKHNQKALSEMESGLPRPEKKRQTTTSIITYESLKKRLSHRASSSIQHVHSVLRLSLSDSYRSSLSWRSSWISGKSLGLSIRSEKGSFIEQHNSRLSKDELELWNDIIDESQLLPTQDLRPTYQFLVLRERPCCTSRCGATCKKCGFSVRHAQASAGDPAWYKFAGDKNQTDIFGNTPLHYSAASGIVSLYTFTNLIPDDVDIHARNTLSESLLHLLDTRYFGTQGIGGSPAYLGLLKHLKSRGFSFSNRDCHGRTILHILLKRAKLVDAIIDPHDVRSILEDLSDILEVLKPDLNALDNQGYNVGDELISWCVQLPSTLESPVRSRAVSLVDRYRNPLNANTSFRLQICPANWKPDDWLEGLVKANLITWIDIHGDTPLTAILKKWKHRDKELELQGMVRQLVNLGVDINVRDRYGNTALAIAAIRGLRASVAELLILGAMPNSRDYRGNGIIAVANSRMHQASKAKKNEHYSRILSCVALLADFGAKEKPTQYEEWLPSAFQRLKSPQEL
jgi:hypothetical protein